MTINQRSAQVRFITNCAEILEKITVTDFDAINEHLKIAREIPGMDIFSTSFFENHLF